MHNSYLDFDTAFPRVQCSCTSIFYRPSQQVQQFTSRTRRLSDLIAIVYRQGNDLSPIVVSRKPDPDARPPASDRIQLVAQCELVYQSRRVYTKSDSSADFLVLRGLFVDIDPDRSVGRCGRAVVVYAQGCEEAADAPADYCDAEWWWRGHERSFWGLQRKWNNILALAAVSVMSTRVLVGRVQSATGRTEDGRSRMMSRSRG